ncbi:MAG: flap endonuclease-1 [Thermoplasmataceae archaeon]
MGVNIADIVVKHETKISDFSGSVVSVDAFNIIYQFLSSIRQNDGSPLTDLNGNVTSHLSGLFYKTISLINEGIKPVFVFDGKPSILKQRTISERRLLKEKAKINLEEAIERGDLEKAAKLRRTINYVTPEIVNESKQLLQFMGIPYVQAISEGELQASIMNKNGMVQAVISQDYDCLLFGARKVLRNFTLYGRRRISSRNIYISINPEYIDLQETLQSLGINRETLVDVGILIGTDFNEGLPRVGAKTALSLMRKHGSIEEILKIKNETIPNLDEIRNLFLNPDFVEAPNIKFEHPDRELILKFLCDEHDFSSDRISKYIDDLELQIRKGNQANLDTFF